MAWYNSLWSRNEPEPESNSSVSLAELEKTHVITHVEDTPGMEFAVAAPRAEALTRELGTTSASPWTSFVRQEYNPKLMGLKGLEVYDRMRKSDGTVRGTLRAIKMPVLSGRWYLEPADDSEESKRIAQFIWRNLTEMMSISWSQVLTEALLMLEFGSYMFEKVWEFRVVEGELRLVLQKLAPRHPMDVKEWHYDAHGGPAAVSMWPDNMNTGLDEDTVIPIGKLLVFTFDREAGNIEGISVLRSAYKHWYFKEQLYKIDAIQKERHGIGIPVIKLPMGYKDEDKRTAEELGRNIRTNERAHITLPPGWDIAMLKLEGQPVDALTSIEHHNASIRENILVSFLEDGANDVDLDMFMKASRFIADIVRDTYNLYLVPQMVDFNFPGVERYPKLKVRRIGEAADWRTLSFAVRNLIGAGAIIPDDALEANLRDEMDLPLADPETAREIMTPQAPSDDDDEESQRKQNGANVGLPRQSPPNRQRNAFGRPRSNSGTDRSGGQ